jgi:4-aminobutyrate aminotransferase/(S)-3-amino-2-methylpropionate transaminase
MLRTADEQVEADLICLGKGLGGGLPISAVVGSGEVMRAWERDEEVVHTATFSGAPLACAAALATLDVLSREGLPARAAVVGERWRQALKEALPVDIAVRGVGLMIGIDLGAGRGAASRLAQSLLERGYLTSTGGGAREVLVLTPPLNIPEALLYDFVPQLVAALRDL